MKPPKEVRPFIPYEVALRPGGVTARLVLPAALTVAEAGRLCEVIRSLAFPGDSPAAPGGSEPDE